MKKILLTLLTLPFLIACSSDNDEPTTEPTQDYTSFVVTIQNTVSDNLILSNCVAGYKKDGKYYKIADLGDLRKNKLSTEVRIDNPSFEDIYIFSDYNNTIQFDTIFILKTNKNNIFEIGRYTKGIEVTDKSDSTQYPQ